MHFYLQSDWVIKLSTVNELFLELVRNNDNGAINVNSQDAKEQRPAAS